MRLSGMSKTREFKFDRGDWVAIRVRDEYRLVGKVRDADGESITVVDRNGLDEHFVPGEDPIVHAYWRRGGRWYIR